MGERLAAERRDRDNETAVASSALKIRWLGTAARGCLLLLGYAVVARLGVQASLGREQFIPLAPEDGVALAALLLWGSRYWPAIFLGGLLSWLAGQVPVIPAAILAAAGTGQTLLGAWLVRRIIGPGPYFERAWDVVRFLVLGGLVPDFLGSIATTVGLFGPQIIHWPVPPHIWLEWWLSCSYGDLVVAPLLLVLSSWRNCRWQARMGWQAALLGLVLALLVWLSLNPQSTGTHRLPMAYTFIPPLALGAFWLGPLGAAAGVFFLAVVLSIATTLGLGPFLVVGEPVVSRLALEGFLAVSSASTLTLAAIVTERSKAEANLAQRYERLADLDRMKNFLLASVSHEIRTPLAEIIGNAELLQDLRPGEELPQAILKGANRLAEKLTNILDYSALVSGSLPLYKTDVNIGELVNLAIEQVREKMNGAALELESSIAIALPWIQADPRRLFQMVTELLDNAVKYVPSGSRVGVRVLPKGRGVRIEVWDTGPGIAPQDRERIWEPFAQGGSSWATRGEGLGLGLAIVKRLAEAHGGNAGVDCEPGKGSIFWIQLPPGD